MKLLDKFVVTSAGQIINHMVLGSRFGSLAIYTPEVSAEPLYRWSPASPGDAVTSVVKLSKSSGSGYFLTTSRNGTYSIFSLAESISMVHQGTPPFGPTIEAAWFSGTDLILYGFKSKNFILWNESQQYEISSVECGGAHRNYAYSPIAGCDGAGHFIFTKASRLYLHTRRQTSHQIIKPGGHGREIKACAVSSDGLIATGAEDTTIRVWRYLNGVSDVEKQFDCLAVIQKHATGIQHLLWHGSSYLFSSGGNEEFFIWAVESIPGFGIGLVCEASCPNQSEEQDLRIMSFDVSSVLLLDDGPESLLISLAYSDSTIKCYTYSKAQKFHLVAKGQYTSSCLMQLRHLKVAAELFFVTAGTDGYLTAWKTGLLAHSKGNCSGQNGNPDLKLSMISNHKLHQSSIKALDIAIEDRKIIVASGGDDNALGVTVYQADDLAFKPRSILLSSAHAAAITGLTFANPESASEDMRLVTSSNDQRVKEWALKGDLGDQPYPLLRIIKVGDAFTSVADVGDVVTANIKGVTRKVFVVGNGMEVYNVALR